MVLRSKFQISEEKLKTSLAEKIIRAETTEELKRIRNGLLQAFKSIPNAEEVVDRDYSILRDELVKRGEKL
jgi:hypothetical protein